MSNQIEEALEAAKKDRFGMLKHSTVEMIEQALTNIRSGKYHVEEVPEGMKEPILVDRERLNEGYLYRDCSQGCPLRCEGDIEKIIDSGDCYQRQIAYLRGEREWWNET